MKEQLLKLHEILYQMIRLAEGNDEIVNDLLDSLNDLNKQIKKYENEGK